MNKKPSKTQELQRRIQELEGRLEQYKASIRQLFSRRWSVLPTPTRDGVMVDMSWLADQFNALKALVAIDHETVGQSSPPRNPVEDAGPPSSRLDSRPAPETERNNHTPAEIQNKADTGAIANQTTGISGTSASAGATHSDQPNLASLISKSSQ